ncbi:MAG: GGDEF domain-containing protein [Proteobacteria bacterium]|nr:GGDEF domain-containing protein [Pseudomonadota bacterium]MBU4383394.1 GGDEF domain-containing protein [Pseudomonadota bacterium]MCG2763340.1 GGDEF domain-containing protein [Desulfarculaceae bacterium]
MDLLSEVVNSNHPPEGIDGSLAHNQSLQALFHTLRAIRASALALAGGDLGVKIEAKGYLAGSLKTLQAHFKHLTWQTQRVAAGDFSQRVDLMGEFATGFNAMVRRLARTVEALQQKEAEVTAKNQELVKEINNRLRVEKDLRISEERYREMAIMDHLTGLYNRRHFYVLAENELKRTLRRGHSLALIMLDLDHFKKINDNYGHDVGDKVLMEVGRVLTSQVRSMDICARLGGEEFVLLLPETQDPQALNVAERLRESIAHSCVPAGDDWVGVTVSLGVTGLNNVQRSQSQEPKDLLELLIKQADRALYTSKTAGRNRITVYELPATPDKN